MCKHVVSLPVAFLYQSAADVTFAAGFCQDFITFPQPQSHTWFALNPA